MRPRTGTALCLALALGLLVPGGARAEDAPAPDKTRMAALVQTLAGPTLKGRGTPEDRRDAAVILEDAMAKTGVRPAPYRDSFGVPISAHLGVPSGRNVLGWIPGAGKE